MTFNKAAKDKIKSLAKDIREIEHNKRYIKTPSINELDNPDKLHNWMKRITKAVNEITNK